MAAPMHNGLPQLAEPWNLLDVLPFPFLRQMEENGYAGHGFDLDEISSMWPVPLFAIIFYFARAILKDYVFVHFAPLMGANPKKKKTIAKFGYQAWLLFFYTTSVAFGWFYVLQDEPFAKFPVDVESGSTLFNFHPMEIKDAIRHYYWYQLGFYIAEMIAIFLEPKRSDFGEYLLHHITTTFLVALSYVGHQHRVGAYIFFIHDVTDIFLSMSKMLHYTGHDTLVNFMFVAFTASFAFLRIYCFPAVSYIIFAVAPQFNKADVAYWVLAYALSVVLQGLHVMWFYMILRMIFRLLGGATGDPRSDDEDEGKEAEWKQKKKDQAKKDQAKKE